MTKKSNRVPGWSYTAITYPEDWYAFSPKLGPKLTIEDSTPLILRPVSYTVNLEFGGILLN